MSLTRAIRSAASSVANTRSAGKVRFLISWRRRPAASPRAPPRSGRRRPPLGGARFVLRAPTVLLPEAGEVVVAVLAARTPSLDLVLAPAQFDAADLAGDGLRQLGELQAAHPQIRG